MRPCATMALMDIADIDPLFAGVAQALRPGGRFVFTVMHPCFNHTAGSKMVEEEEEEDREGEIIVAHAVKISKYITPSTAQGLGIIGQPAPPYYFHRPLSVLLDPAFRAGFAVEGVEEPVFDEPFGRAQDIPHESSRPFSWSNYPEIPPVLAVRLRLPKN